MNYFSVIPAVRVSCLSSCEVRVMSQEADLLRLDILQSASLIKSSTHALKPGKLLSFKLSFEGISGRIELRFVYSAGGRVLEEKSYPYEVIKSSTPGTGLIDGCWVSIVHFNEDEARWFNPALKTMKDADFSRHIQDMHSVGINGVVIQNLFNSTHHVGRHSMDCESYDGAAFYPSKIYPARLECAADDPVEAILSAADRCGMQVLLGIGLYAWFDFSAESLKWHKMIAKEVYELYSHHSSFYGWYVSEEIMGDMYYEYMPDKAERWRELPRFFREFREYVHSLDPVKPIAFAPNNVRFQYYEKEWKEVLPYIDILLPFAFARDMEHFNLKEMKDICDSCHTHMWVDMEVFKNPFDDGLRPKECGDLIKEISHYLPLEQCYGYQYTGLLNHPDSPFDLGGEDAKRLYREYGEYYRKIISEG